MYTLGRVADAGECASDCHVMRAAMVRLFVVIECLIHSHCETKLLYSICGRLDKRGKLYKLGK